MAARTFHDVLNDPSTSDWLKSALRTALEHDAIEAANDADVLRSVLMRRAAEEPVDLIVSGTPLPVR
jgi:hypothetical protein